MYCGACPYTLQSHQIPGLFHVFQAGGDGHDTGLSVIGGVGSNMLSFSTVIVFVGETQAIHTTDVFQFLLKHIATDHLPTVAPSISHILLHKITPSWFF